MFLKIIFILFVNLSSIIIFKRFANFFKLIDVPNHRKKHKEPTPLIGGLIIYISLIVSTLLIEYSEHVRIIIYSSSIIFLIGLFDDIFNLGVIIRIFAQFSASLIVVYSGLYIIDLGYYLNFGIFYIGIFSVIFTLFAVISLTNAFNFIDGLDGLAGGLVLIAMFSILIFQFFSYGFQNSDIIFILIPLLLTYLIFNMSLFSLKKIFLGDSGSLLLGFLISWLLIYFTYPDSRTFHPVLTVWAVSIPVFDTVSVISRRLILRRNIFLPDLLHIHHLLINYGYSKNTTLFIILISAFILSLFGLAIYKFLGALICLISYFILMILYFFISYYLMKK